MRPVEATQRAAPITASQAERRRSFSAPFHRLPPVVPPVGPKRASAPGTLGCLIVSRPSGVTSHITANQVSDLGWSPLIIAASAAEVSEHKRHRRAPRRRLTDAVRGRELLLTLLSRAAVNWIYDGGAAKSIGYQRERRGYTYLHLPACSTSARH